MVIGRFRSLNLLHHKPRFLLPAFKTSQQDSHTSEPFIDDKLPRTAKNA